MTVFVLQGMFEPYLKGFFVHSSDPTHIRLLKVNILVTTCKYKLLLINYRLFSVLFSQASEPSWSLKWPIVISRGFRWHFYYPTAHLDCFVIIASLMFSVKKEKIF